jgi:hypothetical protein
MRCHNVLLTEALNASDRGFFLHHNVFGNRQLATLRSSCGGWSIPQFGVTGAGISLP